MLHLNHKQNILATPGNSNPSLWLSAVPDLIAFVLGLGMAWLFSWQTRDLIWSLWLSSLTLGYATIVLTIFGSTMKPDPAIINNTPFPMRIAGGLFLLAFFTIHFGGFHLVHGVFVSVFFPLGGTSSFQNAGFPLTPRLLGQVVWNYWPFVIAVAISMRRQLGKAIFKPDMNLMAPYANVIRLHLLIFFFAGAHFLKLENFLVYAVVYFVYFFPFSLFFRKPEMEVVE